METRIRIFLLSLALLAAGCSSTPARRGDAESPPPPESTGTPVVVDPRVERREVTTAKIDSENWEVGPYVGSLSVEDFEVNMVYGARLAYHLSEDFFAEAIGGTSEAGLSSFERLSGGAPLLTDSERQFTYYSLGFGWNVLPGEVFLGGKRAYNSSVYLALGAGSTQFAGADRFTLTLGAGARVSITDWLAVHLTIRDLIMDVDVLGANKSTHNYEATLGVTTFF